MHQFVLAKLATSSIRFTWEVQSEMLISNTSPWYNVMNLRIKVSYTQVGGWEEWAWTLIDKRELFSEEKTSNLESLHLFRLPPKIGGQVRFAPLLSIRIGEGGVGGTFRSKIR